MSKTISWDHITTQVRTIPLRTGTQTVQIKNVRRYVHPRSGNRCVGFDLINEWGEQFPYGLSIEPEHRGLLDQFLARYLQRDPDEFDPEQFEALEGEEVEIEVCEDESGRTWTEPVY